MPRQLTDAAEDARHPASVAIRLRNLFRLDNSACSIRSAGYRIARGLLVLMHPCMYPTFNPPSRCMTYLDKNEISRAIQRQRPSNCSVPGDRTSRSDEKAQGTDIFAAATKPPLGSTIFISARLDKSFQVSLGRNDVCRTNSARSHLFCFIM